MNVILFYLALILPCIYASADGYRYVRLQTGTAELRRLSTEDAVFNEHTRRLLGADEAATDAADRQYRDRHAWGDSPRKRQFIVMLSDASDVDKLENFGCKVRSYLPSDAECEDDECEAADNAGSWLISCKPADAAAAAAALNAFLAPVTPELKKAPQWASIFKVVQNSMAEGGSSRRRLMSSKLGAAGRLFSAKSNAESTVLDKIVTWEERGQFTSSNERRYAMTVLLIDDLPEGTLYAARVAERDWPASLAEALRQDSSPQLEGPADACWPIIKAPRILPGVPEEDKKHVRQLSAYACKQDLQAALAWLLAQPVVTYVEPEAKIVAKNAVAEIIMQTGNLTEEQYFEPLDTMRPYWAAGLMGQDEIVGVGDSGIDLDSCYLADPHHTDYYSLLSGSPPTLDMPENRKVVFYSAAGFGMQSFGDFSLDNIGHGTHVCGSVAGARLGGPRPNSPVIFDEATGAAPHARISFIGGGSGDINLEFPKPLDINMYPIHKAAGAHITSDSWAAFSWREGFDYNDVRSVDSFLWRNPSMVMFVAAGNEGSTWRRSPEGTLGSPALAKNVVAVGATYNHPFGMGTASGDQFTATRAAGARGFDLNGIENFRILLTTSNDQPRGVPSLFRFFRNKNVSGIELRIAAWKQPCSAKVTNPRNVEGFIALIQRCSTTSDIDRVLAVEAVGAVGVLFYEAVDILPAYSRPPPFMDEAERYTVGIPFWMVSKGVGQWLVGNLTSTSPKILLEAWEYPDAVLESGNNDVTDFSSYGPTSDGRIKPDLVAPGSTITSANGDEEDNGIIVGGSTCSTNRTVRLSGTSMATPMASGHATLVRQYLRTGFYPTGSPDDAASSPFQPSGMLIKAVMVAGAKSLKGGKYYSLMTTLGEGPDGYQGFGRINLANSVPLPGASEEGVALQVADWGTFTAPKQRVTFKGLTAAGTGPIRIALVWYDYPSEPQAVKLLQNDLDLKVTVKAKGQKTAWMWGNNMKNKQGKRRPDNVNTVERVHLASPPKGADISIMVRARFMPSIKGSGPDAKLPQHFAVAVVGHFTGTLKTPLNPAYARSANKGASASAAASTTEVVAATFSTDDKSAAGALPRRGLRLVSAAAAASNTSNCPAACQPDQVCIKNTCITPGALRFTMTWDKEADFDLVVSSPNYEVLSFMTPLSADNGTFDVSSGSTGAESAFWPANAVRPPPTGRYNVCVAVSSKHNMPYPPYTITIDTVATSMSINTTKSVTFTAPLEGELYDLYGKCDEDSPGYVTSFTMCRNGVCQPPCGRATCPSGTRCSSLTNPSIGSCDLSVCGGKFCPEGFCDERNICTPPVTGDLAFTAKWSVLGTYDIVLATPSGYVVSGLQPKYPQGFAKLFSFTDEKSAKMARVTWYDQPPTGAYNVCVVPVDVGNFPTNVTVLMEGPGGTVLQTSEKVLTSYFSPAIIYGSVPCDESHPGFIATMTWCADGSSSCPAASEICNGQTCAPGSLCLPFAPEGARSEEKVASLACGTPCAGQYCAPSDVCTPIGCFIPGDLMFVILWDRYGDVDLTVVTPNNKTFRLQDAIADRGLDTDGGEVLSISATDFFEIIRWPAESGLAGEYILCISTDDIPSVGLPFVVTSLAMTSGAQPEVLSRSFSQHVSKAAACDKGAPGFLTAFTYTPAAHRL